MAEPSLQLAVRGYSHCTARTRIYRVPRRGARTPHWSQLHSPRPQPTLPAPHLKRGPIVHEAQRQIRPSADIALAGSRSRPRATAAVIAKGTLH